jgi:hypothetical protein
MKKSQLVDLIKEEILSKSSLENYPPYMYSPIGFGCHVCKYHYMEKDKHMCSSKYYQKYISEQFPTLENNAELVDNNGNPIKDPSKWCSNWFNPKK